MGGGLYGLLITPFSLWYKGLIELSVSNIITMIGKGDSVCCRSFSHLPNPNLHCTCVAFSPTLRSKLVLFSSVLSHTACNGFNYGILGALTTAAGKRFSAPLDHSSWIGSIHLAVFLMMGKSALSFLLIERVTH